MSRWIQRALDVRPRRRRGNVRVEAAHKGALHKMLGVPVGRKIPLSLLQRAASHPEQFFKSPDAIARLRHRAQFALNVRGFHGRYGRS